MRHRSYSLTSTACAGFVLAALVGPVGCGSRTPPPARGVIEQAIDGWSFRRYQQVLDVEVWVEKNPAVAYTASYARSAALRRSRLADGDVVNAVITRYQSDTGILRSLALFCRRLAKEAGYVVEDTRIAGIRSITVRGHGEYWALWASRRHVVKIGGPGLTSLPAGLIAAYSKPYPSNISSDLLEGPLPGGPPKVRGRTAEGNYDRGRPTPEWR